MDRVLADGAEFFPGYAPLYGEFYPVPAENRTAGGSLAFLPPSSGIGHQQNLSVASHIPSHLHEHLFHGMKIIIILQTLYRPTVGVNFA